MRELIIKFGINYTYNPPMVSTNPHDTSNILKCPHNPIVVQCKVKIWWKIVHETSLIEMPISLLLNIKSNSGLTIIHNTIEETQVDNADNHVQFIWGRGVGEVICILWVHDTHFCRFLVKSPQNYHASSPFSVLHTSIGGHVGILEP